jgi:hypothetical protein
MASMSLLTKTKKRGNLVDINHQSVMKKSRDSVRDPPYYKQDENPKLTLLLSRPLGTAAADA